MASYKNPDYIQASASTEFDKLYSPGTKAPYAGIYRCRACGHEIGTAEGHELPPQIHPQHPQSKGPIQWQLAVYAMHQK